MDIQQNDYETNHTTSHNNIQTDSKNKINQLTSLDALAEYAIDALAEESPPYFHKREKADHNTLFSLNLSEIKNLSVKMYGKDIKNYPFIRHNINFSYHGGLDYEIKLIFAKKGCKQSKGRVK